MYTVLSDGKPFIDNATLGQAVTAVDNWCTDNDAEYSFNDLGLAQSGWNDNIALIIRTTLRHAPRCTRFDIKPMKKSNNK